MQVSSGLIGSDRFDFIRAGSLLAVNTFGADFILHILLLLLLLLLLPSPPSSSSTCNGIKQDADDDDDDDDDECVDLTPTDHLSKEESNMILVHHLFTFRSLQITLNFISIFILKRLFTFNILYSIIHHINILNKMSLWKNLIHNYEAIILYSKHWYYQTQLILFSYILIHSSLFYSIRHLMMWAVFAPKLIFEICFYFIFIAMYILFFLVFSL